MATYKSLSDSLVELAGKINSHAYEKDNIKLEDVVNNPSPVFSKNEIFELIALRNQLQLLSSQIILILDTSVNVSMLDNNGDLIRTLNSPKSNKIPKSSSGKIPKFANSKTNKIPPGKTLTAKSLKSYKYKPSEVMFQKSEPIDEQPIDVQSENIVIKNDETLE